MEINEHKIRLSGVANIPNGVKLEKDYDMAISNAEVTTAKESPNGDGTIDKTYTVKITERSEVNLISEHEIIVAKKKKSQSQALRMAIMGYWQDNTDQSIEFEDYYKQQMSKIIDKYNI